MNPVGKGEWTADPCAILRPSLSGSVRVNPTTITVDEGDTVSYTIRLSTAPPHPVSLQLHSNRLGGARDLVNAAVDAYQGSILIPSGWSHPHEEDWSAFTYNWSRGVKATFTAPEDSDNEDDVTVIDHYVFAITGLCDDAPDPDECQQDWDDAWAKSPYQSLTGASVKITVRDND